MSELNTQAPYVQDPRQSGILLHPTSFPSPYGIGELGPEAYQFIDFLEKAGQHLWQVLPLNPTGFGDSPYQSFSAFAGQPLIISLQMLKEEGLLSEEDLSDCPAGDSMHIDYGTIIPWKMTVLRTAFSTYQTHDFPALTEEYERFVSAQRFWLSDYALFMALKDLHHGESWLRWEEEYRILSSEKKMQLQVSLQEEIACYQFLQFLFFKQWQKLKSYANAHGVKIIGDIPIFVSMDSADVWANQRLFHLDERGYPVEVAGVPPDYFSATGQLWGNPLYQWEIHRKEGYVWWIDRVRSQLQMVDYLRIDHFRGFEANWAIPYGEETAVNGTWKKGPDKDLFLAIRNALGEHLPIIAEDLGIITPDVELLRDTFCFPGMKVLQFAFEGTGESSFLPHQFTTPNCVCYTGTHDNDTTVGWYETASAGSKHKVKQYMKTDGAGIGLEFIRTCLSTIAVYAIFPLQDLLEIGKEGRMNCPGVAAGNWNWRYHTGVLSDTLAKNLKELSQLYGRY